MAKGFFVAPQNCYYLAFVASHSCTSIFLFTILNSPTYTLKKVYHAILIKDNKPPILKMFANACRQNQYYHRFELLVMDLLHFFERSILHRHHAANRF